jgi:hypothetical protein
MFRVYLSALVDVGSYFVKSTYYLEGDAFVLSLLQTVLHIMQNVRHPFNKTDEYKHNFLETTITRSRTIGVHLALLIILQMYDLIDHCPILFIYHQDTYAFT